MTDMSQCRLPPFQHQIEAVEKLLACPYFFLALEMGCGKTKSTIDAGQILYNRGEVNRIIVVCPAPVRSVWVEPELGELAKHLWHSVPSRVFEYHAKLRTWDFGPPGDARLKWVVTNYDYLRGKEHLDRLLSIADKKTWLVLDESSAVKNAQAQQTKACMKLRAKCGRVTLLNGTPISQSPLDLFSQSLMMSPAILDCKYKTQFLARYAVQVPVVASGGRILRDTRGRVILSTTGWTNLEDLQRRLAPYTMRRLKADALDLPEKLPPVTISVPLDPATWRIYKQMRDDMVAWLSESAVSVAAQAIVKVMRLRQVTSGFLGGVENEEEPSAERVESDISREKLDLFLAWHRQQLENDPSFKLLVWCEYRFEVERLVKALSGVTVGALWGGQKPTERAGTLRLLDPRTAPEGPVVVVGVPKTGSLGLNLTAAHTVVYLSHGNSLMTRVQSEDRVHRPGQRHVVSYFDIVATGPSGQKTIDHLLLSALREKRELADLTTSAWIAELTRE